MYEEIEEPRNRWHKPIETNKKSKDFYTLFETILRRAVARHPDITIVTGNSPSGEYPRYDLMKSQQKIASFIPVDDNKHCSIEDTPTATWFMLDFEIELYKETRTELSSWARLDIDTLRKFESSLKDVARKHPGCEIVAEQTISPVMFHVMKNGQAIVWCKTSSAHYTQWNINWLSEDGKPFVKDYFIAHNRKTGEPLPDWIKAEIETQKPTAGRNRLACSVWLDYMVNTLGKPIGGNSDKNELFKIWKTLWAFETGKDPGDPSDLADPFGSYTEAASYSLRPKNAKK